MTFLSKVDTTAMAVTVLHSLPAIHFLARLSLAAFAGARRFVRQDGPLKVGLSDVAPIQLLGCPRKLVNG